MHKKALRNHLNDKHQKFIASITDLEVRQLVRTNSIITGGAVASGLLGEEINDYDYYFTDKATVEAVARYYAQKFIDANPDAKVEPAVEILDSIDGARVQIVLQRAPSYLLPESAISEGAGVSPYNYFESRPQDNDTHHTHETEEGKEHYRPVFMTANAITLSDDVQLILRFFGDPEKIHKNYDFVHCTNYWLSKDNTLHLNQPALESLLSKNLYYVGSKYPVCSMIRTRKFIKRGWHINAGQYLKIAFQVSELNLKDIDVLEDQLTGVDNSYFHQIIEYFKDRIKKDSSFKITREYLDEIINRIF
ncbi:hypothetical protein KAR91_11835 [Candidatus Pacearchaeota archaeon]|nr:hypothetical protein [Candidatus Pacearchaeota archaeon]